MVIGTHRTHQLADDPISPMSPMPPRHAKKSEGGVVEAEIEL